MMKYSTWIFDLDGTLLDTLRDLAASVNHAMRTNGMPEHSVNHVRHLVGNGIRTLIERAVPQGTSNPQFHKALNDFTQHYRNHYLDTTKPYPGILPLLATLKENGCHVAVVSNKTHTVTKQLCQHFFPTTVDVAIGENEAQGIRKKPAPDTVNQALQLLNASPSTAVYVGDSDVDILTARNAHLPCISVLWGFRSRQFLAQRGATVFASSPEDLLAVAT
ncbi:MAG: HAD family hydrolase [Prevotella sp.]|nr:HAD family hydrolase [Prevotella sp.]